MLSNSLTLEACLRQALDIHPPWSVQKAELEQSKQRLRIDLRHAGPLACPICGAAANRHDARRRAWRHLDFFEYQTVLTAEVPQVKCPEHGCHQVRVPWSEERSRNLSSSLALFSGRRPVSAISAPPLTPPASDPSVQTSSNERETP